VKGKYIELPLLTKRTKQNVPTSSMRCSICVGPIPLLPILLPPSPNQRQKNATEKIAYQLGTSGGGNVVPDPRDITPRPLFIMGRSNQAVRKWRRIEEKVVHTNQLIVTSRQGGGGACHRPSITYM